MKILLILLLLPLIAASILVAIYNRIVRLKNRADAAEGDIKACLKQRHDLIPNLVNTAKGYMQYEKDLLEEIVELRSKAMQSESPSPEIEGQLSRALGRIFALAENYPELKANTTFLKLQEELSKVEETIQKARRYYNATVRDYNNAVTTFPGVLVASIFNFKERDYFDIPEVEERAPEVRF